MSQEQAFLDALQANPEDDITRSIYADWLEEQGDPRGTYLRAELELSALQESDPEYPLIDQQLAEMRTSLPKEWVDIAGKRWDIWLLGYPPPRKIFTIKGIRELTGIGLAEAKAVSESLPHRILSSCTRSTAEDACRRFDYSTALYPIDPTGDPPVRVVLRLCKEATAQPRSMRPELYDVIVRAIRPRKKSAATRAIARSCGWSKVYARSVVEGEFPFVLGEYSEQIALNILAELDPCAEVDLQLIPTRIVPTPRAHPGIFQVWLHHYPPEHKIAVIKAYRELTGMNLAQCKAWSDGPLPRLIVERVNELMAERIRHRFETLGETTVTSQTPPTGLP